MRQCVSVPAHVQGEGKRRSTDGNRIKGTSDAKEKEQTLSKEAHRAIFYHMKERDTLCDFLGQYIVSNI